jgi:drug/metabolite transporter (DMT)-like permease
MAFVLALVSAVTYGAADFIGGIAARRAAVLAVVFVSQGAGFLLLLLVVPMMSAAAPQASDLAWGAGAGLGGGIGVALLYRALAIGTMGIVAPVTAVCAVILPIALDVFRGERLSPGAAAGIVTALVAIVLVSQSPPEDAAENIDGSGRRRLPPGLGIALLSGVAIGGFYVCLARTHADAGLWPLVSARATSTLLFAGMLFVAGTARTMPPAVLRLSLAGGLVDVVANALYLLAARRGSLSLVVTLVSLYPASTVLLAGVILRERFSRMQVVGIVLALVAVLLIVSNS